MHVSASRLRALESEKWGLLGLRAPGIEGSLPEPDALGSLELRFS